MTTLPSLHPIQYESILRRGLEEDLGLAGDLTSDAIIPDDVTVSGKLVARTAGRIAGVQVAAHTFSLLEHKVSVEFLVEEGTDTSNDAVLARVDGNARSILTAERVALNVLGRMSGIATATQSIVAAVKPFKATVVCTRKTLPGFRVLEKYAVRAGGGVNHRFGLDDAVLIKDNHLLIAGSVQEAVSRVRGSVGHMVKVEVEVDTMAQLEDALAAGVDAVLLDNMDVATLRDAVSLVNGRVIVEASGGITPDTAPGIAQTGVDLLSVGWITHSAPALDVALDIDAKSVGR